MTEESLFDQKEPTEPQLDESQTYYDKLVGPGLKFKDQESLAKGKWYSDAMIEIKNRQFDQLRNDYLMMKAELDSRAKFEDLVDKLDKRSLTEAPSLPNTQEVIKMDNAPRYTQTEIETIVNRRIEETKTADKAQVNFNTVMGKLKEQYGNNYKDVLLNQTESLGLTIDDVNSLARKSPEAFFRTMGLEQRQIQQQPQSPPRSAVSFAPQGAAKKTWSYYQELFKKNPKLYYDPNMTKEMVESHAQLGEQFEDGDFRKFGDTLGRL